MRKLDVLGQIVDYTAAKLCARQSSYLLAGGIPPYYFHYPLLSLPDLSTLSTYEAYFWDADVGESAGVSLGLQNNIKLAGERANFTIRVYASPFRYDEFGGLTAILNNYINNGAKFYYPGNPATDFRIWNDTSKVWKSIGATYDPNTDYLFCNFRACFPRLWPFFPSTAPSPSLSLRWQSSGVDASTHTYVKKRDVTFVPGVDTPNFATDFVAAGNPVVDTDIATADIIAAGSNIAEILVGAYSRSTLEGVPIEDEVDDGFLCVVCGTLGCIPHIRLNTDAYSAFELYSDVPTWGYGEDVQFTGKKRTIFMDRPCITIEGVVTAY